MSVDSVLASLAVLDVKKGFDNNNENFGALFNRLLGYIQKDILKFAMTANNGEIALPCLTNMTYKPNVATSLLLVNRAMYHEAKKLLYNSNELIFSHMGSDLKILSSSVAPCACRVPESKCCNGRLPFNEVTFKLGDQNDMTFAEMNIHGFGCVLRYLRTPIDINFLTLDLQACAFSSTAQVKGFAAGLINIHVHGRLILMGKDYHLKLGVREFPMNLNMKIQPASVCFYSKNEENTAFAGTFADLYFKANNSNEVVAMPGQVIKDSTTEYENWLAGL